MKKSWSNGAFGKPFSESELGMFRRHRSEFRFGSVRWHFSRLEIPVNIREIPVTSCRQQVLPSHCKHREIMEEFAHLFSFHKCIRWWVLKVSTKNDIRYTQQYRKFSSRWKIATFSYWKWITTRRFLMSLPPGKLRFSVGIVFSCVCMFVFCVSNTTVF